MGSWHHLTVDARRVPGDGEWSDVERRQPLGRTLDNLGKQGYELVSVVSSGTDADGRAALTAFLKKQRD